MPKAEFGVVAIGRNEGDRLVRCLKSLSSAAIVVYVDSGSCDGSVSAARELGVDVVELDPGRPFSAARGRNAGFRRIQEVAPGVRYVQFIDGDCELADCWPEAAVALLESMNDVAAVCGTLIEREPGRSIYNWLCQQEWNGPSGEIKSCAGNVMHRASALSSVGGYREDVIAAEEDELCVRLRASSWRIWRLATEMATHDAAMTHFSQWWKRTVRTGYAYAQGAYLHGRSAERHFVWEVRRALLWGVGVPLALLAASMVWRPYAMLGLLVYPLQILRLAAVGTGSIGDRLRLALFGVLARFPESLGVMRFERDRLLKRSALLIEHKS